MTVTALVAVLALGLSPVAAPIPLGAGPPPKVSAPVAYQDLMLVLVTKDGAAAVIFTPGATGEEVGYSFRYESADGKKLAGTGKLFERKLMGGGYDPDGLFVVAGPVKIEWSRGNADRGWIYYSPEVVTVHLAHADNFAERRRKLGNGVIVDTELDLRRFMKK
jgi:hypothetical protein